MAKNNTPQVSQKAIIREAYGVFMQEFSGPLPPPGALEKYGQIIPNGAERIMVMAEEQSKHRRTLEAKALNTDSRNSLLGVIFAFALALTSISAGVLLTLEGYSTSGTIFGSSGFVTLATAFIYGTRSRRKERESKARAN